MTITGLHGARPRITRRKLTSVAGLVAIGLLLTRCGTPQPKAAASGTSSSVNTVARYLTGAELQVEDDGQRREIVRALEDMLHRPPPELRAQRYSDYRGNANAWSVTDLLPHYFVPREPMVLEPQRFYQEVAQAEAKVAIQQQLENVRSRLRDEK